MARDDARARQHKQDEQRWSSPPVLRQPSSDDLERDRAARREEARTATVRNVVRWVHYLTVLMTVACFLVSCAGSMVITGGDSLAPGFGPLLALGFIGIPLSFFTGWLWGESRDK